MKLIYAVEKEGFNSPNRIGVRKKVHSMMRFYESKGIHTQLCEYGWNKGFPTINISNDTDILYFRRIQPSLKLYLKFSQLKKKKNLKIVMEIPTYPFSGEQSTSFSLLKRVSQWTSERLLHFVVDRIVLVGSNEDIKQIYNIPVIPANNGICFEEISMSKVMEKDNQIDLIAVSSCFFWHGYDRLIRGMQDYYQKPHEKVVNFHIVGEGDCLNEYKRMAVQSGLLDKHIFFYGNLEGTELDRIYDIADVAVDCLACHRKNVSYVSALKVREYVAKGLPFITANRVDVYNEDTKDFIFELPADETNIEIGSVLSFYEEIRQKTDDLNWLVRETFRPHCEWEAAYNNVINYFMNES